MLLDGWFRWDNLKNKYAKKDVQGHKLRSNIGGEMHDLFKDANPNPSNRLPHLKQFENIFFFAPTPPYIITPMKMEFLLSSLL